MALPHKFYSTMDSGVPEQIKDRNGYVVLKLCKLCNQAEGELTESCPSRVDTDGALRTLVGIKVGDTFIRRRASTWRSDGGDEIITCSHVTAKFADVGGSRYRIETGAVYGEGSYSRSNRLRPYTPQAAQAIRAREKHLRQADFLKDVSYRNLPSALVNEIYGKIHAARTARDKTE